jgi:hypothetical protein
MESLLNLTWYIAHPYTGAETNNLWKVTQIAAALVSKGVKIFSPLNMWHEIHLAGVVKGYWPKDEWELYLKHDEWFMEKCDGIILCGNYEKSKGCLREQAYFEKAKKYVFDLEAFLELLRIQASNANSEGGINDGMPAL